MKKWMAGLVGALGLACGSPEAQVAPGAAPVLVKTEVLQTSVLTQQVEAPATVLATNSVTVFPEMTGIAVDVPFEDGASVQKGARLVKLRDDTARASVQDAEARMQLAEAKYRRITELFERGNASAQEKDVATAERDLAQAAVSIAKDSLRKTDIRAPFSGKVGIRRVAVGATLTPTTAITQLEDLNALVAEFTISERDLPRLALGNPIQLEVDADPSRSYTGTLIFLSPRVDERSRTAIARASLEPSELLRPGMSATIRVDAHTLDAALLIPSQAVITGVDGAKVFVIGEDGRAESRKITTGERLAERIEAKEGLKPGDKLIIEGLLRLQPGSEVRVAGETQP